ncbi:MAG: MFS transporter, partial [Actinobacteria bacterium]|nr:MFS transporter [Actinomycetota bacterium]
AMLIDAVSFGISAWFLLRMRHRGDRDRQPSSRRGMWREVAEGLRYCATEPRLRAIAGAAANLNLFSSIALALMVLYLNRVMGMPPVLVSLVFAAWGAGALAGSVLAPLLGRRFTEGRTIVGATAVFSIGLFAYPPVRGPLWFETTVIAAASIVLGGAVFVFDVHSAALRQAITPGRLQGRSASAMTFLTQGVKPLGALAGGALGETLGVRGALWFAAAGAITSVLWTYWSPLRTGQPSEDTAEPATAPSGPAA